MTTKFKDVKVKAGNLDKDGYINLKMDEEATSSNQIFNLPDDFMNRYFTMENIQNGGCDITDENDLKFCRNIYDYIFSTNNAPFRLGLVGFSWWPEVGVNLQDMPVENIRVTISDIRSYPDIGEALARISLIAAMVPNQETNDLEFAAALEFTVYKLDNILNTLGGE